MKWKALLIAAVLLTAAVVTPAHALDYAFDGPSSGDFAAPTSDDTIREWKDPNVDRSGNSALIPPGFGTPTSYLPGSGEFLTPNLAAGGPLKVGSLIPGTVGTPLLPGAPGTGYPSVSCPTVSGPAAAFTELTPSLYYSDGSLGVLEIPSIGLTVQSLFPNVLQDDLHQDTLVDVVYRAGRFATPTVVSTEEGLDQHGPPICILPAV